VPTPTRYTRPPSMIAPLVAVLALVSGTRVEATPVERQRIRDYAVSLAECPAEDCGKPSLTLRSFRHNGEARLLTVDPQTLETRVIPSPRVGLRPLTPASLRAFVAGTPYGRALAYDEDSSTFARDAGIVHALPPSNGVVLTIDLCPSFHPLDRRLFETVVDTFRGEERPIPIGIAITGRWMQEHPEDLSWLKSLDSRGAIRVTWIDHSFTHRYRKDLPAEKNFLLQPGTNLTREVLATERALLERGLNPSVFFRFPGLISDRALVRGIGSLGLIAVGSDAWLAKKEEPSRGSIVLVHGNGNEPYGVARFLALLRKERKEIRSHNWLLFDLRESLTGGDSPR